MSLLTECCSLQLATYVLRRLGFLCRLLGIIQIIFTRYISFHCYRLSVQYHIHVQYHDNTQLYTDILLEEFN